MLTFHNKTVDEYVQVFPEDNCTYFSYQWWTGWLPVPASFYCVLLILKLLSFSFTCSILYIYQLYQNNGLNCFPVLCWKRGRVSPCLHKTGKTAVDLFHHTHTHTQNPNIAHVTIQLFAKSGMQWQTNSRGFHWNTNVSSIPLTQYQPQCAAGMAVTVADLQNCLLFIMCARSEK